MQIKKPDYKELTGMMREAPDLSFKRDTGSWYLPFIVEAQGDVYRCKMWKEDYELFYELLEPKQLRVFCGELIPPNRLTVRTVSLLQSEQRKADCYDNGFNDHLEKRVIAMRKQGFVPVVHGKTFEFKPLRECIWLKKPRRWVLQIDYIMSKLGGEYVTKRIRDARIQPTVSSADWTDRYRRLRDELLKEALAYTQSKQGE